ncbi:DUF397 domain-containing protein [Actinomadura madurae]|uniref:DUF397 domain-containing protein n=1 Tax=Actinomadura madurae TaxID=1993 RepID=UPI0020D25F4E|nr:DUF397 domain-containing protein [Actinomadura madurae]MCP9947306.1 DUF397 domain-containing protein [Actinomadura madurae]MCP9964068.1 DUF397 domain-containing protein [Actinomadura madurae]MCP9976542.1 DUF397 domain-containing protein [Actinomadura madurae]MCQ0011960.1 DUF397 domain-containing protein [Actinomadura madurae]MCQ0012739.1 DUF397 domain-containing protein [Actinomadura madurae]
MINQLVWRKSSYSDAEGQCVEVAAAPGIVAVRDSKDADGPHLMLPADAWRPLLAHLKNL